MKSFLILLLALAFAGGSAFLLRPDGAAPDYEAATVFGDQARPLPAFTFTRHDGRALVRADFQKRWSLIFFGFTNCPDICSPTMRTLTTALDQLGDTNSRIVFVSVDPERDTPEVLARYVDHFRPGTLGVVGTLADTRDFARQLGAFFTRQKLATDYTVDHSGGVWLVGPRAQLAGVFTPPLEPQLIAADLRRLMEDG